VSNLSARAPRTHPAPVDRSEVGATAVEYAIIVSLIAGVIIVVVTLLGLATRENFTVLTDLLP